MSFWVYILKCADKSYYTGHSDDLEKRIAQHKSGEFKCYTKGKLPVEVVFTCDFPTRDEALSAERKIKGWTRSKKEALVNGDIEELKRLSNLKDG